MPERLKIPPTKSALLTVKGQIGFLEQGHEMLERKRELLTRLVYERLAQYRKRRNEVRAALKEAYHWAAIAHMRMGARILRQVSLGLKPALEVRILPRSSLGVEYPAVDATPRPLEPIGLLWTDPSLDEARSKLTRLAVMLAELGEAEASLWRLLAEQRKTQKRVNALKYNIIPRYYATIRFIESALEEEERNTLFQMKILSERSKP